MGATPEPGGPEAADAGAGAGGDPLLLEDAGAEDAEDGVGVWGVGEEAPAPVRYRCEPIGMRRRGRGAVGFSFAVASDPCAVDSDSGSMAEAASEFATGGSKPDAVGCEVASVADDAAGSDGSLLGAAESDDSPSAGGSDNVDSDVGGVGSQGGCDACGASACSAGGLAAPVADGGAGDVDDGCRAEVVSSDGDSTVEAAGGD